MKIEDWLITHLLDRNQGIVKAALISGSVLPPVAPVPPAPPAEGDRNSLTLAQLQAALRSVQPLCYIAVHPDVPAGKVLYRAPEDVRRIVLIAHPDILPDLIQDMGALGYRVQVIQIAETT